MIALVSGISVAFELPFCSIGINGGDIMSRIPKTAAQASLGVRVTVDPGISITGT